MTAHPLRILYYGAGWPTNIGNGFIDFGAQAILRLAAPGAQIAFASEMPRWFFRHAQHERSSAVPARMEQAFDVAAASNCDLVVCSGMAMCREFAEVNGPTVVKLSERGVPLLLLGTGGEHYTAEEEKIYGSLMQRLNLLAFVSRDDQSFDTFGGHAKRAIKGIDCAFFLPEAYAPLKLDLPPFVAAAFDSTAEPALELRGRPLVRAHHDCWGPLPAAYVRHPNTLVSDLPQDYLTLYANAEEVHSDRVHACIAALAYGRKARLYHPTPRGSLFAAVGVGDVRENLVQLDSAAMREKKSAEVSFVRALFEETFGARAKAGS